MTSRNRSRGGNPTPTLSPIDVELLRNGLAGICDEMYTAIMKSAYSTNIKERHDHSAAIFDARGRVVVQGESLPLHLASMLGLVEVVLERYGREGIRPGDMFVSNDPFVGRGSHLPDVSILAPVFRDGNVIYDISFSPPISIFQGILEKQRPSARMFVFWRRTG